MTVKIETVTTSTVKNENATNTMASPADFETAIDAAGFGVFNILLLFTAFFAAIATMFESSTMSYILPSAECHLKLTLLDKGVLNGITYAGMITSAIMWGYLADIKGRKKLLVYGYLADVVVVLGGAFSQSKIQLMVFKYIGGFIIGGPFAVLMSYLTELHSRKYRALVMMILGIIFSLGALILPLIAIAVLPQNWDFELMGLKFQSWQIFLAVCVIPSAMAGSLITLFPESPKFLMSQQRNDEALQVFQKIYAINYRKARDSFPIKELAFEEAPSSDKNNPEVNLTAVDKSPHQMETVVENKQQKQGLRGGLRQLRPLFVKPYLGLSLRVYLINFAVLLGQNTMRLWLPQLFASIEEYTRNEGSDSIGSLCAILEYSVNKTQNAVELSNSNEFVGTCESTTSMASYTNNIVVGLSNFLGYIVAGIVINRVGSKLILNIAASIAGTSAILLYWSSSSLSTLILSSIFVTAGELSAMSVITSSVNLFPTSLRTMIVSLAMMIGRSGSIVGNLLFPAFMKLGCIPPFVMISFFMYFASLMSAFLPNSIKTVLK